MTDQHKRLTIEDIVKKYGAEFMFKQGKYSFYEKDNLKFIVRDNYVIYSYHVNDEGLRKYKRGLY